MDAPSAEAPRHWFYRAAVLLLLVGVTAAILQKEREGAVAKAGAARIAARAEATEEYKSNVQHFTQAAEHWMMLSLAATFLAIVSWCIAIWRRENHRWVWVPVVVLLSLYVLLELMMV
jgi:hypothetical protein